VAEYEAIFEEVALRQMAVEPKPEPAITALAEERKN